jgi:hypothetical protein
MQTSENPIRFPLVPDGLKIIPGTNVIIHNKAWIFSLRVIFEDILII